tara:strand:+ start:404 stop:919 length:516 start_codon:yes stop_codon:yes gene_type:complete
MDKATSWRHRKTLQFLSKHCVPPMKVLDLGVVNQLSQLMANSGYLVSNTQGENLDLDQTAVLNKEIELVTAFEIFEHMLAPFNTLRAIKANKLIASVPLQLWFAEAYWNKEDDRDKHYHEFEIKQFDFLLEKSGWRIIDSETWKPYKKLKLGIRPFLRMITNRYYIVYCER